MTIIIYSRQLHVLVYCKWITHYLPFTLFPHNWCLNIACTTLSLFCTMSSSKLNKLCLDWICCCNLLFFGISTGFLFCFEHSIINNSHILLVIVFYTTLRTPWQDNLWVFWCPIPTFIFLLMLLCIYNALYWRLKLNIIQWIQYYCDERLSKPRELEWQYIIIKKYWSRWNIACKIDWTIWLDGRRCRSRKVLGVQRIFLPNFPKCARKTYLRHTFSL